jgi:predicted PurR-regulated permease PerM
MTQYSSWQRTGAVSTTLLAVIAVGLVLKHLSGILIPFVLAGFLSILFKPVVEGLRAKGLPRVIGLTIVLGITSVGFWTFYQIAAAGAESFSERSDFYTQQLNYLLKNAGKFVGPFIGDGHGALSWSDVVSVEGVTAFATQQLTGILTLLSDSMMVLLYLLFMLLAGDSLPQKIRIGFAGKDEERLVGILVELHTKIRKYLQVKTAFNIFNGFATWVVLLTFGVDFAALFGLIAFALHYIPNIGSILSTVLPVALYLVQTGDAASTIILLVVLTVVQNVIGNVLEPKVMGVQLKLSPVVVLFSLLFWGWMWGVVGMILSIPIVAVIKVILESFPNTHPLSVLMGNGEDPRITHASENQPTHAR